MSIKVLYIVSSLRRSGPVNVLYSIVKDAMINNIEPIIVTLKPEFNLHQHFGLDWQFGLS